MGGFHDILSKAISSIRRFVDHNIWSMRRLGDYDVLLTTTYRLKFVELRRNSSKFSRKRTRNNSCFFVVYYYYYYYYYYNYYYYYYYYYYLHSKSTVAGGIDCLVILYLHASSDCLESRMLLLFFSSEPRILFFTSASCRLGSGTTHDPHSGRHVVYLGKTYFLSKSTGITREAVSRTT